MGPAGISDAEKSALEPATFAVLSSSLLVCPEKLCM